MLSAAALCWAGNYVVGRSVHDQITPLALSFTRWAVALLVLLPFTLRTVLGQLPIVRSCWRLLAVLALVGMAIYHTVLYKALEGTTAINASLILSTAPIAIAAFSWLLDRERLTRAQAAGIAVSLGGAGVLISRGELAVLRELRVNPGDLWMMVATPGWALYCVLLRRKPANLAPMTFLTVTIALSVAFLAPAAAVEFARDGGFRVDATTAGAIGYVAVFASVVAYVCWNRGVAAVGANRAGLFLHLVPVFSTALAIMFLGERLAGHHLAGIVLIAAGIWLTTRSTGPA